MYDTSNMLVRSLVIWDHTWLPATRQRWFSRLYPQRIAGTHLCKSLFATLGSTKQ